MENKKKILGKEVAIIGYWFATNYGGVASYYSLYKTIQELKYKPFFVENPYYKVDKEGEDVFSKNFFRNEGFEISQGYDNDNLNQLNNLSDTFLLGSDQVLTTSSIKSFGKLFLMSFAADGKRRIAYSSSCGGDNLNDNASVAYAREQLLKFSAISVREYSTVDLMRDKFGIKTEALIDPIFFTKAKTYIDLGKKSGEYVKDEYFLSYVLDPTEDKKKCIEQIATHLSLSPKIILDGRKYTHDTNVKKMDMNEAVLPELNMYQWLYYLSHASYIFTDSFHGAVMALILNKPCVIYINRGRGYPRFVTLNKMFDLGSKIIESSKDLNAETIDLKLDYLSINRKIDSFIDHGKKWLNEALSSEKKLDCYNEEYNKLQANRDFKNIRLLATLLRDYGVKHIVLSPGGRDVPIIRMFENNSESFILHRVTDERSAAYYGLGIAAQLRQPVACICTSGTAASNYLPAVTEAYYTGIPLIVITADRYGVYLNHGEDQTIPQKNIYWNVVKMEVTLPESEGWRSDYQARRDISSCILEATHNGFGPVHINVPIDTITIGANSPKVFWKLLPFIYPHILRASFNNGESDMMRWVTSLKKSPKILVVYGQNAGLTDKQKRDIELFASKYNCVIVTDSISNLNTKYSLSPYIMLQSISQAEFNEKLTPDILITVGGKRLMNDPLTYKIRGGASSIRHWAVSPDGKIKDFYFRLTSVLECTQDYFFEFFSRNAGDITNNGVYYEAWRSLNQNYKTPIITRFNSLYIQSKFLPSIPKNSILHLGVGQSFIECRRFNIDSSVEVYCNMGTNGIDGCTSTFMGQCAVVNDRLCFLLVGDLSFFYDMNSIWNKPLKKNIRVLMVNNNGTGLLRGHNLQAVSSVHNTIAEGWVRSTGFEYMAARSKEEYDEKLKYFLSDRPAKALFFEVFCE